MEEKVIFFWKHPFNNYSMQIKKSACLLNNPMIQIQNMSIVSFIHPNGVKLPTTFLRYSPIISS